MKKPLLITFLFFFSLQAKSGLIDQLLSNIENGDRGALISMKLPDMSFNHQLLKDKKSAADIYRLIKRKGGSVYIENIAVSDSIDINQFNSPRKKLVFLNCKFDKAVLLDKAAISDHIAFISCHFVEDVKIKDVSTINLTFLANELQGNFLYAAAYKSNQINNFNFILNMSKNFSVEAYNERIPCPWSGKLTINNFMLSSNYLGKVFLSAITVKDLFFMPFNIIQQMELNGLKIDIDLIVKSNSIGGFKANNLLNNDKADIIFFHNSFKDFQISGSILRTCIIIKNRIEAIHIQSFFCNLAFRLATNLFKKGAEIKLTGNDFKKFAFSDKGDSITVAMADTLYGEIDKSSPTDFSEPLFVIPDSSSGKPVAVALKYKTLQKLNSYKLNLSHPIINADNWYVDFKDIKKSGDFYRIVTGDSLLESRHEVYTSIQKAYANQGKWSQADQCFYEWKEFERLNTLSLSGESILIKLPKTLFHYLNWLSCGYGIKPLRIFPFAFFIILIFALFYFVTPKPISNLEGHLISSNKIKKRLGKLSAEELQEIFAEYDFDFDKHKQALIDDIISSMDAEELTSLLGMKPKSSFTPDYFWNCFYFSFSTFTTVGMGDWYPTGRLNKAIVMLEGSLGWLCLGLFITTYANILLR